MTSDFFNAVILSTAKRIAALFAAGDTKEATRCLEQHIGAMDAADGALFMIAVQDFVQGKR